MQITDTIITCLTQEQVVALTGARRTGKRTGQTERLNWLKDYRQTYLERDIADVGQVANIDTFALAQKLLCSRTANLFSISEESRNLGAAINSCHTKNDYMPDLNGTIYFCKDFFYVEPFAK